jgi:hypothetical protein
LIAFSFFSLNSNLQVRTKSPNLDINIFLLILSLPLFLNAQSNKLQHDA